MIQLGKRREDIQIPFIPDAQAEVHIVERHGKRLIQPAERIIQTLSHHQAGARHRWHILRIAQPAHIAEIVIVNFIVRMSCGPVRAKADDHPRMLDCPVAIVELCADGAHIGPLGVHQHRLKPVHWDHLGVIVQ